MQYNQFCPIAKATEILGEKWTLLILRELLMGSTRFGELQRSLGNLSPALLTKRLKNLEKNHLIVRAKDRDKKGFSYYPTESAKDLMSILEAYGKWGLKWTKDNLSEEDYDVELLMVYLERSINAEFLPDNETIIHFHFTDVKEFPKWWIIVENGRIEVCAVDPGKDVDVFFVSKIKIMTDAWLGHVTYKEVIYRGELLISGPTYLTRTFSKWLVSCPFADIGDDAFPN